MGVEQLSTYLALLSLVAFLVGTVGGVFLIPLYMLLDSNLFNAIKHKAVVMLALNLVLPILMASLQAQLAIDYVVKTGYVWLPIPGGLLTFAYALVVSWDRREGIIEHDSKWTQYPLYSTWIKYWRVPYLITLPLFIIFLYFPKSNISQLFHPVMKLADWLFRLPAGIGILAKIGACVYGLKLLWGSIIYIAIYLKEKPSNKEM